MKTGKYSLNPAAFTASIIPKMKATVVTDPTTNDGLFQNFQKKIGFFIHFNY